jgi:hypothetical protein
LPAGLFVVDGQAERDARGVIGVRHFFLNPICGFVENFADAMA